MTRFRMSAVAVTLAALLLCFTPARAGDAGSIELAVANVAADTVTDETTGEGTAYGAAYDLPVGAFGRFGLHFSLDRVDGIGSSGQGGWAFGLGGAINFGDMTDGDGDPMGLVSAYVRGDMGITWADTRTVTEEIPVDVTIPPSLHGSRPAPSPLTVTEIELDVDVSEQFVTAAAVAGVRLLFDRATGLGVGAEVAYRTPLSDGVDTDSATAVRVFMTIPAGAQ